MKRYIPASLSKNRYVYEGSLRIDGKFCGYIFEEVQANTFYEAKCELLYRIRRKRHLGAKPTIQIEDGMLAYIGKVSDGDDVEDTEDCQLKLFE